MMICDSVEPSDGCTTSLHFGDKQRYINSSNGAKLAPWFTLWTTMTRAAEVATEGVVQQPSDGSAVEDHVGVTHAHHRSTLLLIDLVKVSRRSVYIRLSESRDHATRLIQQTKGCG